MLQASPFLFLFLGAFGKFFNHHTTPMMSTLTLGLLRVRLEPLQYPFLFRLWQISKFGLYPTSQCTENKSACIVTFAEGGLKIKMYSSMAFHLPSQLILLGRG